MWTYSDWQNRCAGEVNGREIDGLREERRAKVAQKVKRGEMGARFSWTQCIPRRKRRTESVPKQWRGFAGGGRDGVWGSGGKGRQKGKSGL